MISNIQVLRGLAALAVVFYHTDFRIPGIAHSEMNGVAVFFAISGFIMSYITRVGAPAFLLERFIRIVPFYWLVTLFAALAGVIGLFNLPYVAPTLWQLASNNPLNALAWLNANVAGGMTDERLTTLANSLAFVPMPSSRGPVLGVGWSLNLEIFYYLIFGLALAISRKWAPVITATALVALWLYGRWAEGCGDVCSFYTTRTNGNGNLHFSFGILIYYIWSWIKQSGAEAFLQRNRRLVVLAAGLFAVDYVWAHAAYDFWYLGHLTLPATLVLVSLLLHMAAVRFTWHPLLVLGDASYSLYLTHTIVLEMMRPFGSSLPALFKFNQHLSAAAICSLICVLVAIAVHKGGERPLISLLRRLRSKFESRQPTKRLEPEVRPL